MTRHGGINYRCDQCDCKGTQMPLKGWDAGFLISDMDYCQKRSKITILELIWKKNKSEFRYLVMWWLKKNYAFFIFFKCFFLFLLSPLKFKHILCKITYENNSKLDVTNSMRVTKIFKKKSKKQFFFSLKPIWILELFFGG